METPMIKKALSMEEIFAMSEVDRRRYELRELYLHDQASMIYRAREEAMAQGMAQGKHKVALRLLGRGMEVETGRAPRALAATDTTRVIMTSSETRT